MALLDWLKTDRADVKIASDDLAFMLRQGDEMFRAATGRLLENEILDVDLEALDQEVDDRERHLRTVVVTNIRSPSDPRFVEMLKLLGVVQEAERIGDLAITISAAAELADGPRMGPRVQPFRDLRDRISEVFDLTRAAFEGRLIEPASQVLLRHEKIKRDLRQQTQILVQDASVGTGEAVALALGARMMGRVSSHLANIASAVVFPFEDLRRTHLGNPGDPLGGNS